MTGTLESSIHPPAEDVSVHEPDDKTPRARASHSKATARTTSAAEGSKSSRATSQTAAPAGPANTAGEGSTSEEASRRRATAARAARVGVKRKGSVLATQEVSVLAAQEVEEEHSANVMVATAVRLGVETPVVESADHEDLQSSATSEGSRQGATKRLTPSWIAVKSWVGSNLLLSGLTVALVVAVVLLTLTQLSLNSENSLNSARTSALAAAKSYAVDLASYNYQHLDQDFGKVLAESTPAFKQDFDQSTVALKAALTRYDASARGTVVAEGVVSATTSRAVVLVFLNQTVYNTLQKNQPTTSSRVELTLLRSGGLWLIDQVTLL